MGVLDKKIIKKPVIKKSVIKKEVVKELTELEKRISDKINGGKTGGRKTKFSEDMFFNILNELATSSKSITTCCKENNISRVSFMSWCYIDDELLTHYDNAKTEQLKFLSEEIIEISDKGSGDTQRDKLRIEARKWILSKLDRKNYGEQVQQDITIKTEQPMFQLSNN
jgi:hypothetical protein